MDTLAVTGGHVLLPEGSVRRAEVLVDQESGSIVEVSPSCRGDTTLDASGSLVTPGFVNGHCHAAMTLFRGYADDKPLERWLREDIWPLEAALTPDDIEAGARLGLLEMIKAGITSFADMYFAVDRIAEAVEDAGVRAVLGHGVITAGKDESAARADAETGLDVAERVDGMGGGRITGAFMPHSLTTVDPEIFEASVPRARALEVPIHLHANETRDGVEQIRDAHGVDPLTYAADVGLLEPPDFIAHGVHLTDGEIDRLSESGAGVIHCPASNMKLASGMAPVQRLLDAGVPVGLGTDGPASNNDLSLLDEGRDAAMIGKLAANDAAAVSAGSVVHMLTEGSASVLGLEAGRIEEGAPADLAVVDFDSPHLTPVHDHVSHLVYAAMASDVRHTVCDGQVLMRDRTVETLEETDVRQTAADRATALLERTT